MKRKANYIVLTIFFALYLASWLPYFGIVNAPTFIGPFPQPMAFGIAINVLNTALVLVVYFAFFKPYGERMRRYHEQEHARTEAEQKEAQF
ncbi:hypothetical protein GCM10023169_01440 [Georgenia halophila]|uniref:DUF485 domain-containing protein n=1 Tax=Georgenia halophila TaxID=620889 RepID=A0ABP8KSJ3_9MICO